MNTTPTPAASNATLAALDAWIDAHFDEEVRFLQELVRVPTDTPPGNNAPHAERTAELLAAMGLRAERHAVPEEQVRAGGLESLTNLIVRHRFGPEGSGPTIALNAHGDVVPPGEGWTHDPYGGEIVDGRLYGRAAAVSKSDFATYTFALRAVEALGLPLKGAVELHFTYDEEFGGELGPGWLLDRGLTRPDLMIAAGFSYQVVVAHNGCLQLDSILERRSFRIEEEVRDAENRQKDAAAALADAQQKLAKAQAEAEQIRAAAEENAKTAKEAILAQAAKDVERLRETAAQDLDVARERAIAELRERVAVLSIERVESQLRSHLDDSAQHQLIDRSIAIVGGGS